jgi:hypothetical protein
MKTLNIDISELEFQKFGLKKESFSFSELIDVISREITKQNLEQCLQLAEKHNLDSLSMEEITNEVNAVRSNAKGNS